MGGSDVEEFSHDLLVFFVIMIVFLFFLDFFLVGWGGAVLGGRG